MATKSQRKQVDPFAGKLWLSVGEAAMLMSRLGCSKKAYQVRELVQSGKLTGRIGDSGRYVVRQASIRSYLHSLGVLDAATAD